MIDPKEFNFVSQVSHTIGGALAVIAGVYLFGPMAQPWVCGVGILAAAVKEFWYDQNYETPEVRGSNLQDFSFYCAGLALGSLTVFIKLKLSGVI